MPGRSTEDLGLALSDRPRVLAALARLCAEQGYEATTIEQVAERSGVPLATVTQLYANKEACAKAAIDAILAEVMQTVAEHYSLDLPERSNILLGIRAILELLAAKPSFAHVSFICARQMGEPQLDEGRESGARLLSAMMERLRDESERMAPSRAARAALGGAEAVVRREIALGRLDQLPRLLPEFIYAAAVPFLGQEEALRLGRQGREVLRGTAWQ